MTFNKHETYRGLNALGSKQHLEDRFALNNETAETPDPFDTYPDDEAESLDQENERIVKENERVNKLLGLSIKHVQEYDSLDTALQIVSRAYHRCPSITVKRDISNAAKSLKAAIKTDKWMKIKRRRRHVDEHTRKKNLDTFFEKIAEVVATVQLDSDKRQKKLFIGLRAKFASELPTRIKNGYTLRQAHVVVMSNGIPNSKYKTTRLEGGMYLIENATIVGVNNHKYRKPLDKADMIADKRGVTVYHEPLSRPGSYNIAWFVILDFGVGVTYVSFADTMEIYQENSDHSYESFIKDRENRIRREAQLKTQRLRSFRQQFTVENNLLFQDERFARIELDNVRDRLSNLDEQFAGLTMVSDTDNGLPTKFYTRLEEHMQRYLGMLLSEGHEPLIAKKLTREQRIEARTKYYERVSLAEEGTRLFRRIKFLNDEIASRRKSYAASLGLVSLTKAAELD